MLPIGLRAQALAAFAAVAAAQPPGALDGAEKRYVAVLSIDGLGVRQVGVIEPMSLTDVGPTIASFLGLALPDARGRDVSAQFRVRP